MNEGPRVAGYYALTTGSVHKHESPQRIAKGLANHPIGVVLLARLAVDQSQQGKGLGKALLFDALSRIEEAAGIVGVRAARVTIVCPRGAETGPGNPRDPSQGASSSSASSSQQRFCPHACMHATSGIPLRFLSARTSASKRLISCFHSAEPRNALVFPLSSNSGMYEAMTPHSSTPSRPPRIRGTPEPGCLGLLEK